MDEYVEYWYVNVEKYCLSETSPLRIFRVLSCFQIKVDKPKVFVTDSANSHLNSYTIRRLRRCSVMVAIILKGTTMHLRVLDVTVLSVFRKHYYDIAEEWLDINGPHPQVKFSCSQSRILPARLTKSAWRLILKSIDFETAFLETDYSWRDDLLIYSRLLTGFCSDPSSTDLALDSSLDNADEEKVEWDTESAKKENGALVNWKNRGKQTKLNEYWKCWFHFLIHRYLYLCLYLFKNWNMEYNFEILKTVPIGWFCLREHIIRPPQYKIL